jgi:hypothetical protein
MSLNSWNSPLGGPFGSSSSSFLTLGSGGLRGRGVVLGEGLEPLSPFGWGGEGVEAEAGVAERFSKRSLPFLWLWKRGAFENLAGIGGWLVFCGTGGVPFAGVPFGFGLFAVEGSAGEWESMTDEGGDGES